MPRIRILSEFETIADARHKSVARFGDGELRLCCGVKSVAQKPDPRLQAELVEIITKPVPGCLVCIPNFQCETPKQHVWANYLQKKYTRFYVQPEYGSAFITRPDSAPWINCEPYWNSVRALWAGKNVILVAGGDRSLTPETLDYALSVRTVWTRPVDAYAEVDYIEKAIRTLNAEKAAIVIMCCGPLATVLAARLSPDIRALDLGHVGMFMRRFELARAQ